MDNKSTRHRSLYIPYAGPVLLEFPLVNKGCPFSMKGRSNFNLLGLLPEVVETIEVGGGAHGVVISEDDQYTFVTNAFDDTVSVIENETSEVIATVEVGETPNGITLK